MTNWTLVFVQDGTSDPAVVILQSMTQVIAFILAIVLAEYAEVVLHFLISSLTQRRPANQGWSEYVGGGGLRKHIGTKTEEKIVKIQNILYLLKRYM